MKTILLGTDRATKREVRIPMDAFRTHFHLIGGTGKGKTTAIHTLLQSLLRDPTRQSCFFIIDRLGNFSQELLLWMSSKEFCTEDVRRRLVYIQPAREDRVLGFNPLLYTTSAHGYYKVERATEIILRAWESVNIEAMPRLARWTFNAFWAAAQLSLTIADCVHFLMPGSPHHAALLQCLPQRLKAEWEDIMGSRSAEATRILESSRNRLKPYFESDILRRMFGTRESTLDVLRFMREGKIVLLDLAPRNRLSSQLANTIGALLINEVLATARSLPRAVRYPTYLLLDEFQNFVGPDIEAALPEVRQLGLRLFLSHQSFSQLERGDYDLTSMIFQAQSRLIFGVQGEDADLLAHELASITYDPKRIKEELYTRRQLVKGHRIVELSSWSQAEAKASQWSKDYGQSWTGSKSTSRRDDSDIYVRGEGEARARSERKGEGGSSSQTSTHGTHQALVAEHEEFNELSSRTFYTFEEQKNIWAKAIRNFQTGAALLRLVNDPTLYEVMVKRSAPGFLKYDMQEIARYFPQALDEMDRLIEANYSSDIFVSASDIDQEAEDRLRAVVRPQLAPVPASSLPALPPPPALSGTPKAPKTLQSEQENPLT